MWPLFEICSSSFQNRGYKLPLQLIKVFHYSACIRQNRWLVLVEELVKLFCSNYWQNPEITAAVHYFHYNSHLHYHYRHFHYHCKMHLYCLRILLTVTLDCDIILCLFQLNCAFYLLVYIFLLSFSKLFDVYFQ